MCFPELEEGLESDFEMSTARERTLESNNGIFYRHLLNNNQDIPLERTVNAFKIAYSYLNKQIYPLRLQATSDPEKAHIKIRFCENGDEHLPREFDKNTVAFAMKPRADNPGEQFYNDRFNFSDVLDGSIYLVQIIIHETLHSLGLPHNLKDKDDVLRPVYGEGRIEMGEKTQQAFDLLYHEEYKKALPKALRREKYDTITDEDRKDKINNILKSMQE